MGKMFKGSSGGSGGGGPTNFTEREDQLKAFYKRLDEQTQGKGGPSVAEQQLQAGQDKNAQLAFALANSARGNVNPGLLQKQAMQQGAIGGQELNQQLGQLRAQEQLSSQDLLSKGLGSMRGQDIERMNLKDQLRSQSRLANDQMMMGLLGGAASGLGSYLAKSDENSKKDIEGASDDIKEFLDALNAKKYKYKDLKDGSGMHISVMAQDLEKSKPGKKMVIDTPDGKMVDYAEGFATMLAAMSDMNKRLKKGGM